MSEVSLDAIKKMMEDMCEKSEKRMVEMINKIAPTFSKPPESSPTLDENGIPIPGEHHEGSHCSEVSNKMNLDIHIMLLLIFNIHMLTILVIHL